MKEEEEEEEGMRGMEAEEGVAPLQKWECLRWNRMVSLAAPMVSKNNGNDDEVIDMH